MNSSDATNEINQSLRMTQRDYDKMHFEQWFAEEQHRRNNLLKDEWATAEAAFLAGIKYARQRLNDQTEATAGASPESSTANRKI